MIAIKKLMVAILGCISFSTVYGVIDTISPDFDFIVQVDHPCVVALQETFQVVYTMKNDGSTSISRIQSGTLSFPAVRTLIDASGLSVQSAIADSGTEYDLTSGRWQLTQDALAAGETKQLTLTIVATGDVTFFVQAQRTNFTVSCSREITIPVASECPVSSTTTLQANVSTFSLPATITYPNTVNYGENFVIEYTVTNNQTFAYSLLWSNVFPILLNEQGQALYEVVSIEVSNDSSVDQTATLYPSGRGQGYWLTPTIQAGETVYLRITLQATDLAPNLLAYITFVDGNPSCTFGPVQIQITDEELCDFIDDPVAQALASLI